VNESQKSNSSMTARTRAIVGIVLGALLGLCPILIPVVSITTIQRGIEALDRGEASTSAIETVLRILHISIVLGTVGFVVLIVSCIAFHRAKKQLAAHATNANA
jgi:ABC-type lipoprotein release transport system permease subunit